MVTIETTEMIKAFKRIAPGSIIIVYSDRIKLKTPTGSYLVFRTDGNYDIYPYNEDLRRPSLDNIQRIFNYTNDLENLRTVVLFIEKFKNNFEFLKKEKVFS